jgi:capsular exopolysaccharide synthesis family protein
VHRRQSRNLIQDFNINAPYVTEVRRLLQTLARQDTGSERKVYMMASPGRGEGKSTICALLAIIAARVFHKRTLVIDSDLRRPMVHHLLGISQRPGLFEVMHGSMSLEDATRPTLLSTLFAIPSGRPSGSMGEAYVDSAFASLLTKLRPHYDMIFIDAAPVVPVVEPLLIAEHVDALLIVAMASRTPLMLLRRMRHLLEPLMPKVSGVILNNAVEGLPYYYDYRYYGYEQSMPKRIRTSAVSGEGAGGHSEGQPHSQGVRDAKDQA